MWWQLKKIAENDNEIVYGYGYESHVISGRVRIDKNTERIVLEKLADNDTESGFDRFGPHIWRVCFKEGAPEDRMVAIG